MFRRQKPVVFARTIQDRVNLHRNPDLSACNLLPHLCYESSRTIPVTAERMHALCKAAEVAGRAMKPAARSQRICESRQSSAIASSLGSHRAAAEATVHVSHPGAFDGAAFTVLIAAGSAGEPVRSRSGPQQIGRHSALEHLPLHGSRCNAHADRNRFALANLVFQNAQALRRATSRGNPPRRREQLVSAWLDRPRRTAKPLRQCWPQPPERGRLIQLACVKQLAAESRLLAGSCIRGPRLQWWLRQGPRKPPLLPL